MVQFFMVVEKEDTCDIVLCSIKFGYAENGDVMKREKKRKKEKLERRKEEDYYRERRREKVQKGQKDTKE